MDFGRQQGEWVPQPLFSLNIQSLAGTSLCWTQPVIRGHENGVAAVLRSQCPTLPQESSVSESWHHICIVNLWLLVPIQWESPIWGAVRRKLYLMQNSSLWYSRGVRWPLGQTPLQLNSLLFSSLICFVLCQSALPVLVYHLTPLQWDIFWVLATARETQFLVETESVLSGAEESRFI